MKQKRADNNNNGKNKIDDETMSNIGKSMQLAWGRVKRAEARMWADWMVIGEGLLEGRRWAMHVAETNKPEGKAYVMAFGEYLQRWHVSDMDKSDRAKLLKIMEDRPGVEAWRLSLPDHERRQANNPTLVWRKYAAATRITKPKPRTSGVSHSEYGRAQTLVQELQHRMLELEEELASQRGVPITVQITEAAGRLSTEQRGQFIAELRQTIEKLEHGDED